MQSQGGCTSCSAPYARRAHALEAVAGRYLLLQGGYSGTHELAGDTWLFDTQHTCWARIDVEGTVTAAVLGGVPDTIAIQSGLVPSLTD